MVNVSKSTWLELLYFRSDPRDRAKHRYLQKDLSFIFGELLPLQPTGRPAHEPKFLTCSGIVSQIFKGF